MDKMIVDNRITEYLHSLENSRGDLLDGIEKKAIEDGVPIIRSETAACLPARVVISVESNKNKTDIMTY